MSNIERYVTGAGQELRLELARDLVHSDFLSSLKIFPNAPFGHKDMSSFHEGIERNLREHPHIPQIFVLLGEPASGKTTAIDGLIRRLHRTRGVIDMLEYKGFETRLEEIEWGDPFRYTIKERPDDKERNLHTGSSDQNTLSLADNDIGIVLKASLMQYYKFPERVMGTKYGGFPTVSSNQKTIKLTFLDIPINSGVYIDGKLVGKNRGWRLMKELVRRSGRFQNMVYDLNIIGLAASPEVRRHAIAIRQIASMSLSQEEKEVALKEQGLTLDFESKEAREIFNSQLRVKKILALKEQGLTLDFESKEAIDFFGKTSATPTDVYDIESETDYTLRELVRRRKIKIGRYVSEQDRTQIIGEVQLPWIVTQLGDRQKKDQVIFLHNEIVVPIDFSEGIERHYPLRELAHFIAPLSPHSQSLLPSE